MRFFYVLRREKLPPQNRSKPATCKDHRTTMRCNAEGSMHTKANVSHGSRPMPGGLKPAAVIGRKATQRQPHLLRVWREDSVPAAASEHVRDESATHLQTRASTFAEPHQTNGI